MAKRGDPMVRELAATLKTYFKKKKSASEEPTQKEPLRGIKVLEHGKKDNIIIIENITPKMTGGVYKVIDDVHKGKTAFKESEEMEIRE
jgi:hypothetical protein